MFAGQQPLHNFYVSTSHKSFLAGGQLSGRIGTENFARILEDGCRSIEMECHNGGGLSNGGGPTNKDALSDGDAELAVVTRAGNLAASLPCFDFLYHTLCFVVREYIGGKKK